MSAAITVQEVVALIEECGAEMCKPSLLDPLWMQHEVNAKNAGNEPRFHLIGSANWKAWNAHKASMRMLPKAPQGELSKPVQIIGGLADAESLQADWMRGWTRD